ncbi:Pkinase-domain-containing protein [Lactarius akahatsu]|uniref:non-specific serine/threonine protein kinase n=1 Tax=Lactarius akahatsu TaxID=416441 RepID=A0AAD4LJB2_9AGAM|nr:Pkinase-domain-containing protein [Lactarius akahatsu]
MTQPSVHELYQRLETVGKGSYGSVHKGIHRATGNVVALKIIDLDADDGDDVDSIQREVALLTQLRDGPNITKYYGCHLDGPRVWIVMEFAQGGSVYSLMQSSPNNSLEEKYVVVIVREVLIGLNYLHKSNVIHRDIKAANVLVTALGKVMICDFGVSALLATTNSKRNTFIGTPYWMAPEVAQSVPAYDTKADIWSLGIMIYEMIKGSPPHFRVAHLKVIQMIPKVKPPRLAENEGSKDLRDFIPFTLTESPSDRLTAEELLKARWIKNASKAPVTILKDLLLRYGAWEKSGSKPSDLSELLPWEKENDSENLESDENPWEFDTVRGRSFDTSGSGSPQAANEDGSLATVRPQPSKLPTSLRHLFDSDTASVPDPFRIPGFNSSNKEVASTIPNSLLPPPSPVVPPPPLPPPSVPRDRAARRALRIESSFEDGPNLSAATFAFPPRTISRGTKAKVINGFEDQGNLSSSHTGYASRPSTAPGSPTSETMPVGNNTIVSKFVGRRDQRLDPSDPDLEAVFHRPGHEANLPVISKDDGPPTDVKSAASARRSPASRKRSQSSTQGPRPSLEQNSPLPPDFQFPEHTSSSDSSFSSSVLRVRPRISPTRADASKIPVSLHTSTHSLDARIPASAPRRPSPPGLAPPVLGRSRSATPADDIPPDPHAEPLPGGHRSQRRPSLHRLASLAVMETAPQTKASSKPARGRSGNSAGGVGDLSGVPGLKDVLKAPALTSEHQLGMSDLLPPSPTTLHANLKSFTSTPSHLYSSFVPSSDSVNLLSANTSLSNLSAIDKSNGAITSSDPHTYSPSAPVSLSPLAHRRDVSLPPLPQIRKLDFGALMFSHEETHAELERIVDDLVQCLFTAEVGLTRLLERPSEDRIEEETEDVDTGATVGELKDNEDQSALALAAR